MTQKKWEKSYRKEFFRVKLEHKATVIRVKNSESVVAIEKSVY